MMKEWIALSSIFSTFPKLSMERRDTKRICQSNSIFTPKQRAHRKMRNKMAAASRRKNWRN